MPLLICRTCPRYEPPTGTFGTGLDRAISDAARDRGIRLRHVPCVGGCPHPGNVALDGPGKPRIRFSHITPDDADTLLDATTAYDTCPSGLPGDWDVPPELAPRITALTPKRDLSHSCVIDPDVAPPPAAPCSHHPEWGV